MSNENKKEIDFGKTQSVIVDYVDFRRNMEWFVPVIVGIGIFLLVLMVSLVTLFVPPLDDAIGVKFYPVIAIILGISTWLIIICGILSFKLWYKRSETHRRIRSVHSNLIRKSYFINFELVSATGSTRLEKLTNHLGLVFPEIKRNLKKLESRKRSIGEFQKRQNFLKKINFLNDYDLVLKTTMGFFVIKIFDKPVTLGDVENVARQLHRHHVSTKLLGGPEIERAIIMSKSYDSLFNAPDLSNKMRNIKRRFNLDLILEEGEHGYATVWID